MNTINVENCKTLLIGRRGENEVTTVAFDFAEWQTEFGSGVVDLYVKRFGDDSAYPVVLTIDGTVASWLVTETDTNVAGYGKAEYVYRVDGKIAKSAVFPFFVAEDIGQPASEPPDPYDSWLEQLTALGAETEAHAQAAQQSAENAAESAEDAAGSATSAESYAGQAETAAGLAQAAQTASEAARDAAQTAQASAESSATAASGSAASAAGSATAAAGSASDASASASAAGASASAASASATTASNAATAAQAAQSAAEDAAEDAQQAAQQAHVEYEQLSGEVDDLSDEVSQQKSAIDDLSDLVDRKAGMLVDTASGAIASFVPDNTIDNLLGVTVDIEPVQDLHGYDNPWPGGGGKNKFDPSIYADYLQPDGTYKGIANQVLTKKLYIPSELVGVACVVSAFLDLTSGSTPTWVRIRANVNGTYVNGTRVDAGNSGMVYRAFTPTSTSDYIDLEYGSNGGNPFTFYNLQLEAGSTVTTYSPYSNICPISGWDSVEVERTGVNLFDADTLSQFSGVVVNDDGSIFVNNNNALYNKVLWKNPGYSGQLSLTFRYKYANTGALGLYPIAVYTDGTAESFPVQNSQDYVTATFTTSSNKIVDYITTTYSTGGNSTTFYFQLELGSTASEYKPYAGNRYTIQLGQTVYGGTLDATSGTMTVDRAMVDLGTLSWTYDR